MTEQPSPDLLGTAVKRYRERDLQLSQADLAWLADVSRGTISNLETGRVTPDERTWHRIRTAMALPATATRSGTGHGARPVISAEAVQGIVAAILAIRARNPEFGRSAAERWRRLVGGLTYDDGRGWPEANSELSWLAREIAQMAPPGKLPVIHNALRDLGWMPAQQASAGAQDGLYRVQERFSELTSSVNDIAAQFRAYRDEAQGFERLPARVQDLLLRGQVVDYEINTTETTSGVSLINLVVINESESLPAQRKAIRDIAHHWSAVLKIARYILERLAPDRDPGEIIHAVEYGLRTQATTELDKLRQQARGGHTVAMYNLGKLLRKSVRPDEAEVWLRRAADDGHPGALFNLGKLVDESGRPEEAELWFRRAAETGHTEALFSLWKLHQENGRLRDAEVWLRRAADDGHRDAMFVLWKLARENGQPREADEWLRNAAEAGHPGALCILGEQVRESGQPEEAVKLLRRAAEAGDTGAMSTFEIMLYEQRQRLAPALRAADAEQTPP